MAIRGTSGLRPALRDSQQETPSCRCSHCGGEVYQGETLYIWGGKRICVDCFRATIGAWLDDFPGQVADALDVDTVVV